MNLKDFLSNKENPPELYWSLVLEKGLAQAGVWYIGESAAEMVGIGSTASWTTDEELISACDTALSSAISDLPENYKEPNKTVFGVPSTWVKDGEIVGEYLGKIKKLCTELSLTPVGFVVLPEAIAHLYKSEEGAPVNAIILGLGEGNLEISVFKLGNLVGTTEVSRSVSIIEDVLEGLSRFEGASPLPSRFIVYDGKEVELNNAKETLLQASWEGIEKINFLHTPKAEILTPDRKVLATCLAGANEIGHVSKIDTQETSTPMVEETITEPQIETQSPEATPESLGFTVGQDILASRSEIENIVPVQNIEPEVSQRPKINFGKKIGETFQKIGIFLRSFSIKKNAAPKTKNNTLIGIGVIIVLIFIVAAVCWWFVPKAKITVFVLPKRFEQQANLTFSPTGTFDATTGIIPAQVITEKVDGDKTKTATGVKLIGNKAVGSVQIANGNGTAINLAIGTILSSSTGLKFVTNEEASVSGQLLPGSPGTATVAVNAGDIGAQYNLAKGEVFSIGNYSKAMVAGTSLADFSGGSSQEISAVSADDQAKLQTDLKNELMQNAINALSTKVASDQIFVDDLVSLETTSEIYDRKIGDSADSVKLSLSLAATGLAADKSKLIEYATNVLKDKIPQGFVLKDSQIDFKFKFVSKIDGNYIYSVTLGANFLPEVDSQKVVKQITGKTHGVALEYLSSIPGFEHAKVVMTPKLPSFLSNIPRVSKNITLTVTAE